MPASESRDLIPTRGDVVTRLFRQKAVFAICFFTVLAGFLLTGQFRPKYRSKMKILVRKERVDPIVTAGQASTPELQGISVTDQDINSEVELLKGEDLLCAVILRSGLVAPGATDPIVMAEALRKLQRSLDVAAVPKTNLISVSYESRSSEESLRVLQSLEALYPSKQRNLNGNDFEITFFQQQVADQRKALDEARAKFLAFTQRTKVLSADLQLDLTVHQMEDLRREQLQADANIANLQGTTDTLRAEIATEPARVSTESKSSDNPQLLEQLKATLLGLQLKRTELLNKYDPGYRAVADIDREISTNQKMLDTESKSQVREDSTNLNLTRQTLITEWAQTEAQLFGLRKKRTQLSSAYKGVQRSAEELATYSPQQQQLLQDVKTSEDQYKLYVDKLQQAKVTHALDAKGILNVVIAQEPIAPALPQNTTLVILAEALLTALILSVGAAFLFDIFDPNVRTAAEIEDVLDLPILAEFARNIHFERGTS